MYRLWGSVSLIFVMCGCGAVVAHAEGAESPSACCAGQGDAGVKGLQKLDVGGIDRPGGTIKGIIKFNGRQAKRGKQNVGADAYCARVRKDKTLLKETYVFGNNDTLQNVFVYISDGLKGKKFDPPAKPVVFDQRDCQYVPHVIGIVVNQKLEIHSSDDTPHNVKLQSKKNGRNNNAMPVKGMVVHKTFKKPEIGATYKCDVHPWMKAYLHIMPHPFFAVTQENGTFVIKGLSAGEYELSVWHEFSKFKPDKNSVKVKVEEGKTAEVAFTYAPPKRK